MGKLTVRAIESAKPKSTPYKLMDGDGLQLRVATNGVKTWLVRYVVSGAERQYKLPKHYRDTGGDGYASLQDARDEAAKIRALGRSGVDYQIQIEQAGKDALIRLEAEQAASKTINDLFEVWVLDTERKDKGAELRRMFGRDVLPFIGAMPVTQVAEDDIRNLVLAVVGRGSNRLAVMLLSDLKQMFRWAEKRKMWRRLIEDNPAESLKADKLTADDYEGDERTRTLSAYEIQQLAAKLPDAGLVVRTQIACWIMLSCCCRIGELIKARWAEIDMDAAVWVIPKANAKNNCEHVVFLSAFALACFKQLRAVSIGDWCYPARDGKTHLCLKSTTKQIRDRQMSAMNRKPMQNRSTNADALILAGGDWIPHDLRRTGATMMQELRVAPQVIELVLNHVEPNKLRRTYQTHDYANEQREAWQLLGERLEQLTKANAPAQ